MSRWHVTITTSRSDLIRRSLYAAIVALIAALLVACNPAPAAASPTWHSARSTWYGPDFYGNKTACGQRYTGKLRGVAIPTAMRDPANRSFRGLKCGDRILLRRRGRISSVTVIDRCPGCYGHFDLSARTAQDLCSCVWPFTMNHRWTHVRPRKAR